VGAEFLVRNLGCKVNRAESDALVRTLMAAGATLAGCDEAKVVIVNTCTVTGEAEAKARKAIRQALAGACAPWVVATGCAVAVAPAAFAALGERVLVVPEKGAAAARALELLGCQQEGGACAQAADDAPEAQGHTRHRGLGTRRVLKIQDGCDNRCSYCIVHVARGPARSEPASRVAAQLKAAEDEGVREAVLAGIDIGAYRSEGQDLCALVQGLLAATTKLRLRLSSLEANHASDRLLGLMAASEGRLCAHLHLPLQSGCDRTLARMRRSYDTAFFAGRAERARTLMPRLALTTDVIVGFPAERDEDFRESQTFCGHMGFSRIHVFRYSPRPGTPAAAMAPVVPPEEKAARAQALRAQAAQMQCADLVGRLEDVERVLVEHSGQGTSESYLRVSLPAGPEPAAPPPGALVAVRFSACRGTLMYGTPLQQED
jgi:threonylcarbamoyladenosine tRNA methylthiotransferase MtaB